MSNLLRVIEDEGLMLEDTSKEDVKSLKMLSSYEAFKYVLRKRIIASTFESNSGWEQIQIKADVKSYEDEILHSRISH